MPQLLERTCEVAAIAESLDSAAAGAGSLVLVEGSAGLGKTALLTLAADRARERAMGVLAARGHELERALSFGLVRQLFEPALRSLAPADRRAVLSGPARLAGDLLDGQAIGAREGDELEVIHGLYWLASNLADRAPLLVVVDDAQWGDRSSLAFLLYLAQRAADVPIAVIAAIRSGEPGSPAQLLAPLREVAGGALLALDPLSTAAVEKLVRERYPRADAQFAAACARATGGNPLLAHELLSTVASEGLEPSAATAARTAELAPESLLRWTLSRLERLPAGARALAEAVAVLGDEADLQRAAQLAGAERKQAAALADALAGAAILTGSARLSFAHPLLRTAVYAQIPEAARAERHRAAAALADRAGDSPEQVGAQLLNAAPAGDPWAVERLRQASRIALDRGAADSARRYLVRAAEEPPPDGERGAVLAEAAQAEALIGEPHAIDRMRAAIDLLDDRRARAEALYRFGWMLYNTGALGESVEAFAAGLEGLTDQDDELTVRLQTAHVALRTLTAMDVDVLREIAAGSPDGDRQGGRAQREVLTRLALLRVFGCERSDEAVDMAARAIGGGAMVADEGVTLSFAVACSCLIWSDALDVADAAIADALEECRRRGTYAGTAYVLFGRSWVRYWQGRVSDAAADAKVAIEAWRGGWGGQISIARYYAAVASIELGDLDEAEAILQAPGADAEAGEPIYAMILAIGRGALAFARGDAAAAWALLAPVEDEARPIPMFANPGVFAWRSLAALAAARAGDGGAARRLLDEELALARRFGAARGVGVALRAFALVEGGGRGIDLLEEAAGVLERSPSRLEYARALTDLGAARRADGQRTEARDPLRRALDVAGRSGATAIRDRARAELLAAGGRPRRMALTGADALTPSERRVAELAAAGRSNPQIAQELFLSRKTVEFHLSGAYRKLGVASRGELPEALRG